MYSRRILNSLLLSGLALLGPAAGHAQSIAVTFQLTDGTVRVARVILFDATTEPWSPKAVMQPLMASAPVRIPFEPGREAVALFELNSGGYLVDGPFRWPSTPSTRIVADLQRRTIIATLPTRAEPERPWWIDEHGIVSDGEWPRCTLSGRDWICVGVPARTRGVLVFSQSEPVLFAHVPSGGQSSLDRVTIEAFRRAVIVLLVTQGLERVDKLTAQVVRARPLFLASRSNRIHFEPAAGCRATVLSTAALLVACQEEEEATLQIAAENAATVWLPMPSLSHSLLNPLQVELSEAVLVSGFVQAANGREVPRAQLILSELIEVEVAGGSKRIVRRSRSEAAADPAGHFEFRNLGPGRYELLAMHPQLGRGTLQFEPGPKPLVVRLAPAARVVGRVVQRGVPVPRAVIDLPPDHWVYMRAVDPFDIVSPAVMTEADGRFEIALPPAGASEIRITRNGVAVRRPLPTFASGTTTDLGDIELASAISVAIMYVGDERCTLVAAGPLGHSGLNVIEAIVVAPSLRRLIVPEPGTWVLRAQCGDCELLVEPPIIEVPFHMSEWSTHVTLRPR